MRLFVCVFLASCAPLGAVDLRVPVEGAVATTEWDVARVEVSDLRLHWPSTAGLELIPSAWAHPGHGSAGDVGAELLGAWTLEPDARELGEAVAWAGRYTSASFSVGEVVLSRGTEELRVRVRLKVVALAHELGAEGGEVLDDPVVHDGQPPILRRVRVRVRVVRRPRGPNLRHVVLGSRLNPRRGFRVW